MTLNTKRAEANAHGDEDDDDAASVLSQWFVTDVAEWVRQVEPPGPGVGTSVAFFGDGTLAACGKSRRFWLDQIDRVSYT